MRNAVFGKPKEDLPDVKDTNYKAAATTLTVSKGRIVDLDEAHKLAAASKSVKKKKAVIGSETEDNNLDIQTTTVPAQRRSQNGRRTRGSAVASSPPISGASATLANRTVKALVKTGKSPYVTETRVAHTLLEPHASEPAIADIPSKRTGPTALNDVFSELLVRPAKVLAVDNARIAMQPAYNDHGLHFSLSCAALFCVVQWHAY